MPLNIKIILAMILVVFAGLIIVFTFISPGLVTKSIQKEKAVQFDIARQVRNSISIEFEQAISELESLADIEDVKSLDKDKLDYILDIANKTTQFYNYFFVVDRSGKWLSYPSSREMVGKNIPPANMFWIDSTFAGNRTFFMPVLLSSFNTLVSGFSTPVISESGTAEALLRGVVVLSENNIALKLIKDIRIGENGFVYIVSSKGNLLAHPQFRPDAQEYYKTWYSELLPVRNVTKGESGVIEYQYEGEDWVAAYTPVGHTGWGVIAQQPLADITAIAKRHVNTTVSIFVMLIFPCLLIIAVLVNYALKPLANLVYNIERNKPASPGASWANDEIGRIGRKFEELYSKLYNSNENLEITIKKLRTEEERVSLALEGADLGMWDWNIVTGEVYFNQRWSEMLGYKPEEIVGNISTWERLVHPDDMPDIRKILNAHIEGKTLNYESEHRLLAKDGTWVWVLDKGRVTGRDASGKAMRAAGTHLDITRRKVAEQKLNKSVEEYRKINAELEEAREKAEESDFLKTAFLANLSHEIRTPMNGILGFAELLKNQETDMAAQNEYIEMIEQSGQRMLRLINDLIDISKIEAGQVVIKQEAVNLNELMERIYSFFKPQVHEKRLAFSFRCGLTASESHFLTDLLKLEQILTNLLSNALKFTTAGSMHFEYSQKGENLLFRVEDTGTGIPEKMHEKIFERFLRAENTYSRSTEGSGLGLSISKAFVEMMGGKIWLESEPGKGSVFSFSIPALPVQKTEMLNPKASEKAIGHKITILVVEDDTVSFMYLKAILEKRHCNLLHAPDGNEAIRLVKEHPEINIVLMDMKMYGMNGMDATREVKKLRADLPVIAQTAFAAESDRQLAFDAGCDGFITKPINSTDLIEKIRQLTKA